MAKVTLFFKAVNKDEHLASSFLPRERGHVSTTAKWPVSLGRPRKKVPPVPNINRASKILRLNDDVGQESQADSMSIHDEAEDPRRNARR